MTHGGVVGAWYYPNDTKIPHANDITAVTLARYDYNRQVRLGRGASGSVPPGMYRCEVLHLIQGVLINATIMLQKGKLRLQSTFNK